MVFIPEQRDEIRGRRDRQSSRESALE